jgi:hypothetical protein
MKAMNHFDNMQVNLFNIFNKVKENGVVNHNEKILAFLGYDKSRLAEYRSMIDAVNGLQRAIFNNIENKTIDGNSDIIKATRVLLDGINNTIRDILVAAGYGEENGPFSGKTDPNEIVKDNTFTEFCGCLGAFCIDLWKNINEICKKNEYGINIENFQKIYSVYKDGKITLAGGIDSSKSFINNPNLQGQVQQTSVQVQQNPQWQLNQGQQGQNPQEQIQQNVTKAFVGFSNMCNSLANVYCIYKKVFESSNNKTFTEPMSNFASMYNSLIRILQEVNKKVDVRYEDKILAFLGYDKSRLAEYRSMIDAVIGLQNAIFNNVKNKIIDENNDVIKATLVLLDGINDTIGNILDAAGCKEENGPFSGKTDLNEIVKDNTFTEFCECLGGFGTNLWKNINENCENMKDSINMENFQKIYNVDENGEISLGGDIDLSKIFINNLNLQEQEQKNESDKREETCVPEGEIQQANENDGFAIVVVSCIYEKSKANNALNIFNNIQYTVSDLYKYKNIIVVFNGCNFFNEDVDMALLGFCKSISNENLSIILDLNNTKYSKENSDAFFTNLYNDNTSNNKVYRMEEGSKESFVVIGNTGYVGYLSSEGEDNWSNNISECIVALAEKNNRNKVYLNISAPSNSSNSEIIRKKLNEALVKCKSNENLKDFDWNNLMINFIAGNNPRMQFTNTDIKLDSDFCVKIIDFNKATMGCVISKIKGNDTIAVDLIQKSGEKK